MNRTNFEHAFYALLMQAAIGLLTGDWLAGACFGSAFFLGREHAQQQNKGKGDFEAFKIWTWSLDAKLDLLFPVVAVCFVLAAARYSSAILGIDWFSNLFAAVTF